MKYSKAKRKLLTKKLSSLSKDSFLQLPTPMYISKNKKFFIKREDLTGLSLGGNKSRRYEYFFREIKDKGFDSVLHCVSLFSNDAAQISAAANLMGIDLHLIFRYEDDFKINNLPNFTLANLAGTHSYLVPTYYVSEYFSFLKKSIRGKLYTVNTGINAYSVELHSILGCISYVDCFLELLDQVGDVRVDKIVLESGGSSQAGLIFASKFLECDVEIIANNPSPFKPSEREKFVIDLISASSKLLDLDIPEIDHIRQEKNLGKGYGKINLSEFKKSVLSAMQEGILLDPIYTSKSFDLLGYNSKSYNIFIHTGGLSNIFSFSEEINRSSNITKVKPPIPLRMRNFFKNFVAFIK